MAAAIKKKQIIFLKSIEIKNFGIIEFQKVNITKGLNAIIGETGSGKSLILEALKLILGNRADKKIIRTGQKWAMVQAEFRITNKNINFFNQHGIPLDENTIFIKKIIYSNGQSKCFINDISCTTSLLQQFARTFIDLVGQFENQKLLNHEYQLMILDNYAHLSKIKNEYQSLYYEIQLIGSNIEQQESERKNSLQLKEFHQFQLDEIEKLSPSIEEETDFLNKKKKYQSFKENSILKDEINQLIDSDKKDGGLLKSINQILKLIEKNNSIFDSEDQLGFNNFLYFLEEFTLKLERSISNNLSDIDIDLIIDRLDQYEKLKRKHNLTTKELVDKKTELEEKILNFSSLDLQIEALKKQKQQKLEKLEIISNKLSSERKKYAKRMGEQLSELIQNLKMEGAIVQIELEDLQEFTPTGRNVLNFLIETNPNEGLFKLKDIASGGELSRILLALRKIVSESESIAIFLFDEIDSGIGGETASSIGKYLKDISKHSQIITITHLPQIAHYANHLIHVAKTFSRSQSRFTTVISESTQKDIQSQIKSMIPDEVISI